MNHDDIINRRNQASDRGRKAAASDPPALTARIKSFEAWEITDRQRSPVTAKMRARIVRYWLREWGTLSPSKEQVQATRDEMILGGHNAMYPHF